MTSEQEIREKVINGLECCSKGDCADCDNCTYHGVQTDVPCESTLMRDVLALLKVQEPRVMTWEEAQANVNEGPFIIMEVRDSTGTEIDYGILVGDSYEMSEGSLLTVCEFGLLKDDYGKRFRCWTSRPTDEQRRAVKWE